MERLKFEGEQVQGAGEQGQNRWVREQHGVKPYFDEIFWLLFHRMEKVTNVDQNPI